MIPYTIERRPDTGVTNVTLGMWLFIASEVMLFGALFSAYALLRANASAWPLGRAVLNLPIGSINTVVLLTMTALVWRTRSASVSSGRRLLLAGTALAALFLALKGFEYRAEFLHGWRPSTDTFFATYFTLTGLHAVHVLVGAVANLWAVAGAAAVGDAMAMGRFRSLALYWAFVDVVWLVMFVLFYLW